MLVGDLHGLLALERLLAGEHLKHHDSRSVDVTSGVCYAAREQFGGEVSDRSQKRLAGGGVRCRRPGETKVADLDASVVSEQYVLGFEVAVHDAGLVCRGKTAKYSIHDVKCLLGSQLAVVLEQVTKRDAGQVLHDQIGHLRVLPLVKDADHVGMREPGGRASLLNEPRAEGTVVG